jgi:transposase-like protein
VLDLLRAGRTVQQVAEDLRISDQTIYNWRRRDRIDHRLEPGVTSTDHRELVAVRRRIAELETELAVTRRATELLRGAGTPQRRLEAFAVMVAEGLPVRTCPYSRTPRPIPQVPTAAESRTTQQQTLPSRVGPRGWGVG